MPNPAYLSNPPKPVLNVFYVLDTSGSMQGASISRLNRAMEETILALRQVAEHSGNAQIKVAVMEFNSNCRWVQPAGPEDVDDFVWVDLVARGMTNVGAALKELNLRMTNAPGGFLSSATGAFLPVVIFMTDGHANDEYDDELNRILANKWFKRATRVGFAIGTNPDVRMIAKLAGDSEAVIRTNDLNVFARLLRFVTVTSSTLASVSHTSDAEAAGRNAVREALDQAGIVDDAVAPGFDYREQGLPQAQLPDEYHTAVSPEPGSFGGDFVWNTEAPL